MSSLDHLKPLLLTLLSSVIVLLSACESTPKRNLEQIILDAVTQPDQSISDSEVIDTPEFYIRTAIKNEGNVNNQHLLKAAKLLFERGELSSPIDISSQPNYQQLQFIRNIQIQLLAAKIALASNLPTQALELLPAEEDVSYTQYAEMNVIKVQALLKTGNYIEAVRVQIQNEQITEAEDEKEAINQSIWSTISSLPNISLRQYSANETTLKAWIELSQIMRKSQADITWLQEDIIEWATQYSQHPVSNVFIDKLLSDYVEDFTKFQHIAVLLPNSGKYQAVADVISNGILSAYYETSKENVKPTIQFYNTSGENVNIMALYQQAVTNGANIVVGPMDKELINTLVHAKNLEVPVLTLNYAEDTPGTPKNIYQFGLLPEDEAQHIAKLAIIQNKRSAAILSPDSEWGNRIATAFKKRFEALGGNVLSQEVYTPGVDDFSKPINAMLNLDDSNARHKRMRRLLKVDLKFSPQRRIDIDMIFVAATHSTARGILPALKFHHASDIQAYATSHVYTGHHDKAADRDLNGLIFSDIPWTITSNNKLKKTFTDNWASKEKYTRLFALGVDAYDLIHNLKYLDNHNNAYFNGETGNIMLDDKNRLHRKLVDAKFIKGKPVYISPSITPTTTLDENNNS